MWLMVWFQAHIVTFKISAMDDSDNESGLSARVDIKAP